MRQSPSSTLSPAPPRVEREVTSSEVDRVENERHALSLAYIYSGGMCDGETDAVSRELSSLALANALALRSFGHRTKYETLSLFVLRKFGFGC